MALHILLVEDTEDLGENIRDILKMEGYHVRWERNGLAGMDAFSQERPDLIISDIVMPNLNGLDLIRKIRLAEGDNNIPIIILSAKATPEDQQKGMDAGATAYLKKPCKSAELTDTVRELLNPENKKL
ncbi:response regulator [Chryseotalea sanaruensis]|uniref:Response regulator n=1 Tax=Chryseotalea sanaruensis TaxID=2482724 RepID=A0A401UEH6_9BACT|nr:response regulator [Chryseotalea sanaruensis]GCC53270.1 response regulator [Chryseotalea sanaruensis]